MTWLKSTGVLYAYKGERFSKSHDSWMVLNCHPSIMFFYLDQIRREGFDVGTPLAGSHISVVRREWLRYPNVWKQAIGEKVSFEYLPQVKTNGKHWWLPVRSPELCQKRSAFGLNPNPRVPFHLTVAVSAEKNEIKKKVAPKEVLVELERLKRTRDALPSQVWEVSSEKFLFDTLTDKYIIS